MAGIRKITIIGAGCVGGFLATELYKSGYDIVEIISKRKKPLSELAKKVQAKANISDFKSINQVSDLYILCVKDEVILEIRNEIRLGNKIIVHTSGSMTMDVFKKSSANYGVLYPLQTIIRERKPEISNIPFFIEANNPATLGKLEKFAKTLSGKVYRMEEEKRIKLHLAAVIASNFTNYLFKISKDILDKNNIPFDVLKPLAYETVEKIFDIGPLKAQTGPARRGDCVIVDKHKKLLTNVDQRKLYSQLTSMIKKDFRKYSNKD